MNGWKMKLKLLILFLFALCAQNAAATDKRRNNGKIKKIFGALLLSYALNAPTTQTNALCPATLPPYATDMMKYICCAEKEETGDSFEKYLENQEEEYCLPFKLKLLKLHEKVKSLGECAKEKYTDIVHGAKQRIVGKAPDRNTEVGMFQEYLLNIEGVYNAEKLSEKFEGFDEPDFFQLKSVLDLHKLMFPLLDNSYNVEHSLDMLHKNLNFEEVHRFMPFFKNKSKPNQIQMATDPKYPEYIKSHLLSVKHHYRDLNFDQFHRLMPFLKNMSVPKQIKMATDPKYQDYDLDRNEKVLEALKEFSPDDPDNEENALEPWIQQKDLSSEKIDEIFSKCKSLKNQRQCWDLRTNTYKKSDL